MATLTTRWRRSTTALRDASTAAAIDPLLIVFSAGNQGTSGLTRPKAAKNALSVAASENLRTELGGTAADNMDGIAGFSSRGLAADGRIKPDIAAPGTSVSGGLGFDADRHRHRLDASATTPASAPNAAFAGDPATVGLSNLESPIWNVTTAAARLDFKINYNTESTYDGAVLEMKIGAGAFQDILTAGGSFGAGGYNVTLNAGFSNPLPGTRGLDG